MNKALCALALGVSFATAMPTFAQFSGNCLTNKIDISSGYNYAAAALYASSPSSGAPTLDHYWQIASMPTTTTGLTAPKCAERFLTSMVSSSWPNSVNCSWIGVVANAQSTNTAQLSPISNFFWNCPPTTPYTPTMTPTVFTRSFYVQSSNPTEAITVTIPNFWGDDYAAIYLDNNTSTPIYVNPTVSQTSGVVVGSVPLTVTPGAHTIAVRLWDVSGQGSGIKVSGYITSANNVLVSNSCYGISDDKCNVIPPPPICNSSFTAQLTLHSGTGTFAVPDKSIQLTLDNFISTSTYSVDYGDGSGPHPYTPSPAFYTYTAPGTYTVCISEVTSAGAQCKSCYSFCIQGAANSAKTIPEGNNSSSFNTLDTKQYDVLISPNPTSDKSELRLNMLTDDNVKIFVLDPMGRNIADVFSGFVAKGSRTFTINTGNYASGIYQVRVVAGNKASTYKLSVVK